VSMRSAFWSEVMFKVLLIAPQSMSTRRMPSQTLRKQSSNYSTPSHHQPHHNFPKSTIDVQRNIKIMASKQEYALLCLENPLLGTCTQVEAHHTMLTGAPQISKAKGNLLSPPVPRVKILRSDPEMMLC